MRIQNIKFLTKYYVGNINQHRYFLLVYLLGVSFSLFPVSWNGTEVTFFGFPLELYGNTREDSLLALLKEFCSWAWIFTGIFYLLPNLLQRLSESLSINNILWLRFAPCSPSEVATSRALWVMIWAFAAGVLGMVWSLICAYFHQVSFEELLINVVGLVSHIILAGGLVLVLDLGSSTGTLERNQVSFLALISPMILILFYWGINKVLDERYMKFFPYAVPFSSGLTDVLRHFGATALIGFCLLCTHIALKFRFSRVVISYEDGSNAGDY
jgi:hypothetical protein